MVVGIVRTAWSGTSGGPGLTQHTIRGAGGSFLTATEAGVATAAVRAFWDAIKANLPDEIVLTTSPVVDLYDDQDGELIASEVAATSPNSVTGTSTAAYSMATGIKMVLQTADIRDGRRVRGSTFIVPASSVAFSSSGTVASAARTTITTAGNTLRGSLVTGGMELVVWSRKREAVVGGLPERLGASFTVTGIETSEKTAVLRGRRD